MNSFHHKDENILKRMTRVQINLNPLVYGQKRFHILFTLGGQLSPLIQNKQNSFWNSI